MLLRPCLLALTLLLLGTAAPLVSAATAVDDTGVGVASLRNFIATVQSLQAGFTQRVLDSRQQVVEESSGTVVMQRPGRFRWDYQRPFQRLIVADGEKVWLYEADLEQVTIRRLSSSIGDTPAALLTGKESVLERFTVGKAWRADGLSWVSLTPRSADSDFAGVALGFDGQVLRQLRLDDRLGQQTRVALTDVRVNSLVAPDTFRFTTPAGADVIDDSEL